MQDHLLIYVIVVLNMVCHALLIRRLKLDQRLKRKYCALAIGIPFAIALVMRLMIALGVMHGRLREQVALERGVTTLASIFLVAGPFLVTIVAVVMMRKQKAAEALLQ